MGCYEENGERGFTLTLKITCVLHYFVYFLLFYDLYLLCLNLESNMVMGQKCRLVSD